MPSDCAGLGCSADVESFFSDMWRIHLAGRDAPRIARRRTQPPKTLWPGLWWNLLLKVIRRSKQAEDSGGGDSEEVFDPLS